MAFPKDRAAILTQKIRQICRDIPDREATEIEHIVRSALAEERAEGFADGRNFNPE
jgi:hypothetical protein